MGISQRYLLYLSYIGTGFRGSQIQNSVVKEKAFDSVQGTVESALKEFLGLKDTRPIITTLTSRTDTGVHALKAGTHVDLIPVNGSFIAPIKIQQSLNRYFRRNGHNLRIIEVVKVPEIFHARYSVLEKVYTYRVALKKEEFINSHVISPISEIDRTYFANYPGFDYERAKEAVKLFEGVKDFGGIVGSPSRNKKVTICNIKSFTIEEAKPFLPELDIACQKFDYYHFTVRGPRFLYRMVRRMVSVVLAVASNKLTLDFIRQLFEKPDVSSWSQKIIVCPGWGLYLSDVIYNPNHLILTEKKEEEKMKLLSERLKIKEQIYMTPQDKPFVGLNRFCDNIAAK